VQIYTWYKILCYKKEEEVLYPSALVVISHQLWPIYFKGVPIQSRVPIHFIVIHSNLSASKWGGSCLVLHDKGFFEGFFLIFFLEPYIVDGGWTTVTICVMWDLDFGVEALNERVAYWIWMCLICMGGMWMELWKWGLWEG